MARVVLIVAGTAILALTPHAYAASGSVEYRCKTDVVRAHIEAAHSQGHSALFFYRLRHAVDAGECNIAKSSRPQAAAPGNSPPAQRARVRMVQRDDFPPSWLFRPLR